MGHFRRVHAETPTRFWINNPAPAETRLAHRRFRGDREPGETAEKLRDPVHDVRRAWDDGGLAPAECADFGPVALFLGRFVAGWRKPLDIVRRRGRKEAAR